MKPVRLWKGPRGRKTSVISPFRVKSKSSQYLLLSFMVYFYIPVSFIALCLLHKWMLMEKLIHIFPFSGWASLLRTSLQEGFSSASRGEVRSDLQPRDCSVPFRRKVANVMIKIEIAQVGTYADFCLLSQCSLKRVFTHSVSVSFHKRDPYPICKYQLACAWPQFFSLNAY